MLVLGSKTMLGEQSLCQEQQRIDLVKSANEQFNKMLKIVDSMTQQQMATFDFDGKALGKEAH
jgi:hypothetical protein